MWGYVIRRCLAMIPTLLIISAFVFFIIQLPPGDYFETELLELRSQGEQITGEKIDYLRKTYGFDKPLYQQYFYWIAGILKGDLGYSFEYKLPVQHVIDDRLLLTIILNVSVIVFIWMASFPIGIYSATHQYKIGDYVVSFIGFIGLAIPNFLLALILLYFAKKWWGIEIGGLVDKEFLDQPLSWAKFMSFLSHLWVPVIIIGTSSMAAMIRRLRANLLDELQKPYVLTARAKGMKEQRLLWKYPLRMALNPFIADIGNLLPEVISGSTIVAIVLSLPTVGPMFVRSLQSQDMYLAGAFLLFLAFLTVVGTLISDLLLAALDPRIRFEQRSIK